MKTSELHFDELDLREEPARAGATPNFSTTACTTTDACTESCGCQTTRIC